MPDDDGPFNITKTEIECPYGDKVKLPIQIGWVNHDYPMLNVDAPEVLDHLRANHQYN